MSDLRLPAERFSWGVLDAGGLPASPPGSRRRGERLGYLFEGVLPVAIESVQAVYVPLGDGRVLACGMDAGELEGLRAQGWTTLGPGALPEVAGVDGLGVEAASINLLRGAMEAPGVRRARRRWAAHAGAAVAVVLGLGVVGAERRVRAAQAGEREVERAMERVYREVLGPAAPGGQPDGARMTSELRTLRRTRGAVERGAGEEPAGPVLAGLLARWPDGLGARAESVVVGSGAVSVSVLVPDHTSAQALITALGVWEGWRVVQDSVTPEGEGVRLRRAWSRQGREGRE